MPPSGLIEIEAPSALPGLRQRERALVGGLGEGDVPHVRDRGLDDAREPDAGEASVGAGRRDLGAERVVVRELECMIEAGCIVAGVVEGA